MILENRFSNISALVSISIILGACGTQEAIDATRSMPGKLDSMQGTTSEMKDTTSAMKDQTGKLLSSVHLQTMAVAIAQMVDQKNLSYFFPPIGIMPAGKVLAEEATALELMEISFGWLRFIEETDSSDPFFAQAKTDEEREAQKEQLDRDRLARLLAIQVLAAYTPVETLRQIIRDQIESGGGLYESTAYSFIALRFTFTDGMLLKGSLLDRRIKNIGEFQEAIARNEKLEFIASLPYVSRLEYKIPMRSKRYQDPDRGIPTEYRVDPSEIASNWRGLGAALERMDTDREANSRGSRDSSYEGFKARIDAGITRWTAKPETMTPTPILN